MVHTEISSLTVPTSQYGMFVPVVTSSAPWRFKNANQDLSDRTTVEICTAMIAASIPSLKPLFRSLLSGSSAAKYGSRTTKGYMRNDDTSRKGTGIRGDGNDFELDNRQRNMTDIKSGFRTKYSQDNLSDESILHEGDRDSGSGGIKKTTQIFMSVDDTNPKRPKDMV